MANTDEPIYHPEELDDAKREGRPVLVSHLLTYHHLEHTLPLGAIVKCDIDLYNTHGQDDTKSEVNLKGTCTLYVVNHHRDCDGTPLYSLSDIPIKYPEGSLFSQERMTYHALATYATKGGGYSIDSLTDTGKRIKLYENVREYLSL